MRSLRRPRTLAARLGVPQMDLDLDDVGEFLVRPSHVAVLAGLALGASLFALARTYHSEPAPAPKPTRARKSTSRPRPETH